MDALSDVIRLLKPRSYKVGATDVGGDICIRFPEFEGVYCYAVAAGTCQLTVEGESDVVVLEAGDCVVLPSGRPFSLGNDQNSNAVEAKDVFEGRANGSVGVFNGGGGCTMLAAYFAFETRFSQFLLSVLPPIVSIRESRARSSMHASIQQMMDELQEGQPGSELVVEHLAHITLIKALRFHLSEAAAGQVGWLFALADKNINQAMTAMHSNPAQRWSVESLAKLAGMSRTAFATRFRQTVGMPPIDYLGRLRMLIAARLLAAPDARVSVIGRDLGYESESAFSAAFKRVMGDSPTQYAVGMTERGDAEQEASAGAPDEVHAP